MKTNIDERCALLCKLIFEEKLYRDPAVSFNMLCLLSGTPIIVAERMLRRKTGVGGKALLAYLRAL